MTKQSRKAETGDPRRKIELAAIHLGKKALGLDEAAYRTVLEQLTGKTSARDLTEAERARVIDKMRGLGFERTRKGYTNRPAREDRRPTQADLIRTLWGEIAAVGALKDASETALQAFGQRMTGKSRIEWCTPSELIVLTEALKAWLARVRPGQAS